MFITGACNRGHINHPLADCVPSCSVASSHAGSLTNLAKYPASTVQILGAEKALFRCVCVVVSYDMYYGSSDSNCFWLGFACTRNIKVYECAGVTCSAFKIPI